MISVYETPGLLAFSVTVAALLGAVLGSFLNCAAGRLAKEESFLHGRSRCPVCGHPLGAADLVPVLSWLLLGGKCRYCRAKISPRYVLTELCFAALTVLCLLRFDLTILCLRYWIFLCCLFCLSLVDLEARIIPNGALLIAVGAWGLAEPFLFRSWTAVLGHLTAGAVYLGGLLLLSLVMDRLLGRESLGGGDIKLFGVVGLYLGLLPTMFALILACVLGLAANLPRQSGRREPFPFGPWIAAAAALTLFCGDPLVLWYLGLMGLREAPAFLV